MKRTSGVGMYAMSKVPHKTPLLNVTEADWLGCGFNVGTVYELDENNRLFHLTATRKPWNHG